MDASKQLIELKEWCEPLFARTQAKALEHLEERHVDAAVVDIELDVPAGGYDVLRSIGERAPDAPVLVVTKYTDPVYLQALLQFVGTAHPRVVGVEIKQQLARLDDEEWLREWVRNVSGDWRDRAVSVDDLVLPVTLLHEKRARIGQLRRSKVEIGVEVDRLLRTLFGLARVPSGQSGVRLSLRKMPRSGLSAAITLDVLVGLGADPDGGSQASRCVVKMGPVDTVAGEVERYERFVQHGVRLNNRVEMLAHAGEQALGAVCYSFAGEVFGGTLANLDELFKDDDECLAHQALNELFGLPSKQWYGLDCAPVTANRYIAKTHDTDFAACYRRLDGGLKRLTNRFDDRLTYHRVHESEDGAFQGKGWKLTIPRVDLLGDGQFAARRLPACLVHGDMHGGNVMVELSRDPEATNTQDHEALRRVCLIDYGSVGPGPRSVDFVAVDASLRLADAATIVRQAAGAVDAEEPDLSEEQLAVALDVAGKRALIEAALLTEAWTPDGERWQGNQGWARLSAQIVSLARRNFSSLDRDEYIAMAIPSAIRQLGFRLGDVERVRMLAWLSALYERYHTDAGAMRTAEE